MRRMVVVAVLIAGCDGPSAVFTSGSGGTSTTTGGNGGVPTTGGDAGSGEAGTGAAITTGGAGSGAVTGSGGSTGSGGMGGSGGRMTGSGGSGGSGPCVPAAEVCDGVDNDCDGVINNGLGLHGAPFTLAGATPRQPMLAYSGSVYGVVYYDLDAMPHRVALQLFGPQGIPIGVPIDVADTAGPVTIAWNGSRFGVAWGDIYNGGIYFRSYDDSGSPTSDAVQVDSSTAQSGVAIRVSGADFLLAFDDYANSVSVHFKTVRVGQDGSPNGLVDMDVPVSARVFWPRFAGTGTQLKVFWSDNRFGATKSTVFARVLDDINMVAGPEFAVTDVATYASMWSVVETGAGYVMSYSDYAANPSKSYLQILNPSGSPSGLPVEYNNNGYQLTALQWHDDSLAMLNDTEFRVMDAGMNLSAGPFGYNPMPVTGSTVYSALVWADGRYFAATQGALSVPVLRVFGANGCDPP